MLLDPHSAPAVALDRPAGFFEATPLPARLEKEFQRREGEARRVRAKVALVLGFILYVLLVISSRFTAPDIPAGLLIGLVLAVATSLVGALALLHGERLGPASHDWTVAGFAGWMAVCSSISSSQSALPAGLIYLNAVPLTFHVSIGVIGMSNLPAAILAAIVTTAMLCGVAASPISNLGILVTSMAVAGPTAMTTLVANWHLINERRRNFLAQRRDQMRLQTISQQRDLLHTLAAIDPLTGIANRRGFDAMLESDLASLPDDGWFAVAMIDIDSFKAFNDTYGHLKGDETLKTVAGALAGACSGRMRAGRMGGEEFAIAIPGLADADLAALGEALRRAVEARAIPHAASLAAPVVTVSIGLAAERVRDGAIDLRQLFSSADAALYQAKRAGRNRVRLAGDRASYAAARLE